MNFPIPFSNNKEAHFNIVSTRSNYSYLKALEIQWYICREQHTKANPINVAVYAWKGDKERAWAEVNRVIECLKSISEKDGFDYTECVKFKVLSKEDLDGTTISSTNTIE